MRSATDPKIENASMFLVHAITTSGNNPKPVIFHSMRVAVCLYNAGYSSNVVIGAILHDILEDSATTKEEVEKNFGQEIANLITALSYNVSIKDRLKRAKQEIDAAKKFGKNALVIKAADMIDNSHYYHLVKDIPTLRYLKKKITYFMQTAKNVLEKEPIWPDLEAQYEEVFKY